MNTSLDTMDLHNFIANLKQAGVVLRLEGDQLRVSAPKGALSPEQMQELKARKEEILSFLQAREAASALVPEGEAPTGMDTFPVSHAQRRMWVLDHMEEGDGAYNVARAYIFTGQVNREALQQAFTKVIRRHESLRTTFVEVAGEPRQKIHAEADLPVIISYSDFLGKAGPEELALAMIKKESKVPFALAEGPLLRAHLIRTEENRHYFLLVLHHIISDGWSMEVLTKEILTAYEAYSQKAEPALEPLTYQYRHFAEWQNEQLEGASYQQHRDYWVGQFKDGGAELDLTSEKARPAVMTYNGDRRWYQLNQEETEGLLALGKSFGASPFMVYVAILKALLYRFTGQQDLTLGTPVAGRDNQETESQIGFFVNTLALRTQVNGKDSFRDLLKEVVQTTLDAYSHQVYPFDSLVDDLQLKRDLSRNPLFDVEVTVPNRALAGGGEVSLAGLDVEPLVTGVGGAQFDLSVDFAQLPTGTQVRIIYNTDIFEGWRIDQFFELMRNLVQQVVATPDASLDSLALLNEGQQKQLIEEMNPTPKLSELETTLVAMIEEQVAKYPDRIAVELGEEKLTYRELDAKANQIAHQLVALGVGRDQLVPVLGERTIHTLVSILGIWKAGGAFLLLDVAYPESRQLSLMTDIDAKVLLADVNALQDWGGYLKAVAEQTPVHHVVYHQALADTAAMASALGTGRSGDTSIIHGADLAELPTTSPGVEVKPEDLCYIFFTSGSTGKPKGALNEHRGMLNHSLELMRAYEMDEHCVMAQTAPLSFDICVWQFVNALIAGGKTIIYPQDLIFSPATLLEKMRQDGLTVLQFVPSYLAVILEELASRPETNYFPKLKYLVLTGEAARPASVREWFRMYPNTRVSNIYGPAECADDVTINVLSAEEFTGEVTLGRPFQNTRIYIVDEAGNLCPAGQKGELLIAGLQVGRGYLNMPEKTEAVFGTDPFYGKQERLYRTGDLALRRADGTIIFLGRKDYQVKISGQRIELGEIENHLAALPEVDFAAVVDVEDANQNKFLAAFVVPKEGVETTKEAITAALQAELPAFMVPGQMVLKQDLPLTPNGKIDRKALRAEAENQRSEQTADLVGPTNDTEASLVRIWQHVLGLEAISTTANFFELGGQSIKALRLLSMVEKELGKKVTIRDFFAHPTIVSLAAFMGEAQGHEYEGIQPVAVQDHYPVSSAQRRLWVLEQFRETKGAYNMPEAWILRGNLNVDALQRAYSTMVERHESLRTIFVTVNDEPRQKILSAEKLGLSISVESMPGQSPESDAVRRRFREISWEPFQTTTGPLIRASLLELGDDTRLFVLVTHHIISDGWSQDVFVRELLALYQAYAKGQANPLAPLAIQYKDYAAWEQQQLEGESLQRHRSFWMQKFAGELPTLDVPADRPRPATMSYQGAVANTLLENQYHEALQKIARQYQTTPFTVLYAAVQTLLYRYTGQSDIIMGMPVASRNHPDLENQIGFFINTLPLRAQISATDSFVEVIQNLRQVTTEALDHQIYPFDRLLDDLQLERDMSRAPLFDVFLTMQNTASVQDEQQEELTDLEVDSYRNQVEVTKYDLSFFFNVGEQFTGISLHYNTDIFEAARMDRMMDHLHHLMVQLLDQPHMPIKGAELLPEAEKQLLTSGLHYEPVARGTARTVHGMVEEQAAANPEAIALKFGDTSYTYAQLNTEANRLAHTLITENNLSKGDLVAVMLERSDRMVISLLAILKAGGAWLPIEPNYPEARKQTILEDSGAKVLITNSDFMFNLDYFQGQLFITDIQWDMLPEEAANPVLEVGAEDLAYVIYTSGSTGKPKGVELPHRGLVAYLEDARGNYGLQPGDATLLMTSFAFDLCYTAVWGALTSGATLVVPPAREYLERTDLVQWITEHQISFLKLTPAHLGILVNDPDFAQEASQWPLRLLVMGGEAIRLADVKAFLAAKPQATIVDEYGPTEATIGSIVKVITADSLEAYFEAPSIGKANARNEVLVLDGQHQPVPVGVPGEICLAGEGLALGYLNREELTAKAFVPHPFASGQRMYKTGDLGRVNERGEIEFMGRNDHQVKIRGFRIEIGEVEHALQQAEAVTDALVMARKDEGGQAFLIGYYVAEAEQSEDSLRKALKTYLPDYMVPQYLVHLTKFPLTANGKIDRKALPEPAGLDAKAAHQDAGTPIEAQLVAVWKDVLGKDTISTRQNFFSLGGDSIKAIQVASRMSKAGYKLAVKDLFEFPILAELAQNIQELDSFASQEAVTGDNKLTPIQQWFLEQPFEEPHHFNQSVLFKATQRLSAEDIRQMLEKVQAHHDALRLTLQKDDGGVWVQHYAPVDQPVHLEEHDLTGDADPFVTLGQLGDALQRSISLEEGPLMKAALFHLAEEDRLLITVHHWAVDGVSWRILMEDLADLHQQLQDQKPLELPLKTSAYQQWADHLTQYANSRALAHEQAYWQAIEQKELPALPRDFEETTNRKADRKQVHFRLEALETELLLGDAHQAYNTEINDLLMAALGRALKATFGMQESLVALEGHGREEIFEDLDVNRTVGWFTSIYPVSIAGEHAEGIGRQVIAVKEHLHQLPNRGVGYGVLRYLKQAGFQANPDISFNYLGEFKEQIAEESVFSIAGEFHGKSMSDTWNSPYSLEVLGMVSQGQLNITITYNTKHHRAETIEGLSQAYLEGLREVLGHCLEQSVSKITPSDLTYSKLSVEALENLTQRYSLEDIYNLTPLQAGMLFLATGDGEDAYYRSTSYLLRGNLDKKAFTKSWQALFRRHEILRTIFSEGDLDEPVQLVLEAREPVIDYLDLRSLDETQQKDRIAVYEKEDRERGYILSEDVLMRIGLLQTGPQTYTVVWSHHHIIMDGWCVANLIGEFFEIYRSQVEGVDPKLPDVTPYRRYIKWLQKQDHDEALDFWRKYLQGYDTLATLPRLRQALPTESDPAEASYILSPEKREELEAKAAELGVTLNTIIQAVWGILLSRYNQTRDVVFGTVVSGRPTEIPGIENMLGLFINTIPVRVHYGEKTKLRELLTEIQSTTMQSNPYHYCQLAEIQSATGLGEQLLDHVMVFENYPMDAHIGDTAEGQMREGDFRNLEIDEVAYEERTHYNFEIQISPGRNFTVKFGYNRAVYSEEFMHHITQHFGQVIDVLLAGKEVVIDELPLLTEGEQSQLQQWNEQPEIYAPVETLVEGFTSMVETYADRPAIIAKDQTLSYAELDAKSNQLAHYLLQQKQLQPGELVGVMTGRNAHMLIAILAVIKAGGAYVPIAPDYPQDRIRHMVEDTQLRVVLADEASDRVAPAEVVDLSTLTLDDQPTTAPAVTVTGDDLAYVLYTSGSTGVPNGVMIPHQSAVNMHLAQQVGFRLTEEDRILQFASLSFDACVWEWIMALLNGSALVMVPREVIDDPTAFVSYTREKGVTVMTLPPTYLAVLEKETLTYLRILITAGEEARLEDALSVARHTEYWNAYGPSECAVCVSMHQVSEADAEWPSVPVGGPIANTQLHILNDQLLTVPVGVVGEICVSGPGLAKGYWNRPELTDRKFVMVGGKRLYRTGDLGRWLPNGTVEFLGRKDNQVKIRGHRIETGEIAHLLLQQPQVDDVLVVAMGEPEKYLVAYVVAESATALDGLTKALREKLPTYMVPAHFVHLEAFPMTPNGKVDRKALPNPLAEVVDADFMAPETEAEKVLAEVWAKVLRRETIARNENFFRAGGDSIKAMQVAARVAKAGYALGAQDVLKYPVLSELAANLKLSTRQIDQGPVSGEAPLTPIQHWFFSEPTDVHHFNQSMMLRHADGFNTTALQEALQAMVEHHDALRSTFRQENGAWVQVVKDETMVITLQEVDLREAQEPAQALKDQVVQAQSQLDLEHGPLMQPILYQLPDGEYLLLATHHLVVDGVSWRILLEDLATAYEQRLSKAEVALPAKTDAYKTWAEALVNYAQQPALQQEKTYWQQMEAKEVPQLPVPATNSLEAHRSVSVSLDEETTQQLLGEALQTYKTEVSDLLLAALTRTMQGQYGHDRVALALEGHGREDIGQEIDHSRTVGWYTSLYPVVLEHHAEAKDQIIDAKETLRQVPNKGLGYGVLRYLGDLEGEPLQPQINFNYLGQFDAAQGEGGKDEGMTVVNEFVAGDFSSRRPWSYLMAFSGLISGGQLHLTLAAHQEVLSPEQAKAWLDAYTDNLKQLLAHCLGQEEELATPSDMTMKGLSMDDLDVLSQGLNFD